MMCQMARGVFERGDWKELGFSSAIGGRSRGVRLVGGGFADVFEKEAVLTPQRDCGKTKTVRPAATQVVWQTMSYVDERCEKFLLTPDACQTGSSSDKCEERGRKRFSNRRPKVFHNGPGRFDVSCCADKRLRGPSKKQRLNQLWRSNVRVLSDRERCARKLRGWRLSKSAAWTQPRNAQGKMLSGRRRERVLPRLETESAANHHGAVELGDERGGVAVLQLAIEHVADLEVSPRATALCGGAAADG